MSLFIILLLIKRDLGGQAARAGGSSERVHTPPPLSIPLSIHSGKSGTLLGGVNPGDFFIQRRKGNGTWKRFLACKVSRFHRQNLSFNDCGTIIIPALLVFYKDKSTKQNKTKIPKCKQTLQRPVMERGSLQIQSCIVCPCLRHGTSRVQVQPTLSKCKLCNYRAAKWLFISQNTFLEHFSA